VTGAAVGDPGALLMNGQEWYTEPAPSRFADREPEPPLVVRSCSRAHGCFGQVVESAADGPRQDNDNSHLRYIAWSGVVERDGQRVQEADWVPLTEEHLRVLVGGPVDLTPW
jgi:hypothetical protein